MKGRENIVYCFDFCGGGYGNRSDGDVLEMSIFTEQADLEAVLAMISDREDVDSQNIFLAGASQGGVVSAITAAVNPDKERFERVEDIPAAYRIMGMEVGRVYAEDLLEKKENCNEIYREKSVTLILSGLLLFGLLTACGNTASRPSLAPGPASGGDLPPEEKIPFDQPEDPSRDALETVPAAEPAVTEQSRPADPVASQPEPTAEEQEATAMKMQVQVGDHTFSATLENNAAAEALVEMMKAAPIEIQMRDYSGFEKVGSLGTSLPADDRQTTTQAGDIVLYTGNQIVMFYGSNSWSYTRLGRIDDLTGWEEALGSGNITVTFSIN